MISREKYAAKYALKRIAELIGVSILVVLMMAVVGVIFYFAALFVSDNKDIALVLGFVTFIGSFFLLMIFCNEYEEGKRKWLTNTHGQAGGLLSSPE